MKTIFFANLLIFMMLLFAGGFSGERPPEDSVNLKILPESRIGIAGSSNVNRFYCGSPQIQGQLKGKWAADSFNISHYTARVYLTANSLDCGSRRMNKDMYKALDSENFPIIEYQLQDIQEIRRSGETGQFMVNTVGLMTVAGKSLPVTISFEIDALGDKTFRIRGARQLSMHDFNITPPKALLGLIRANDQIEIRFDIVVMVIPKGEGLPGE